MIEVKHIPGCRHGNQLCQYMVGRILSEKKRYQLQGITPEHPEFCLKGLDLSYNQPTYNCYQTPIQYVGAATTSNIHSPVEVCHPTVDLDSIVRDQTPRKIVLDGYFQKKHYFLPYKEEIKKWYGFITYTVPPSHLAVHIRLGDLRATNHPDLLPTWYYEEAIKSCNFDKLTICTDTPNDTEYILPLVKRYNAELFTGNEKETICFLAAHNNLILSVGSFSFWASLFSDGNNIINAIPTKGNNRIDPNNGVDLLIQSPNHKYIKL